MSYVPLHVHDVGSIRDSILKTENYVAKCKELGFSACGISNHGNMHTMWKFYKECKKAGIKPVVGQEFYYAEEADNKGDNYHLCVYAKNNEGLKNLFTLSTLAYTRGFYRKPRIDKKMLAEHSSGLIVTTACCFGMAQQKVLAEDFDGARNEILALQSIFKDDFYLEVHDHGIDEEGVIRNWFRDFRGVKRVLGTDVHYLNAQDKEIHNIFKNLAYGSTGKERDDGFAGTGYHVWSGDEVTIKFEKEEVESTLEIADKCNISIKHDEYHLPTFQIPTGFNDEYHYIREMAYLGLKQIGKADNRDYIDRLEYELKILHLADLESYFLIVMDYVRWCKENRVPVGPGRGSLPASLVGYCLGITTADPIQYDLLFSRGLNAGRLLQYEFFEEE